MSRPCSLLAQWRPFILALGVITAPTAAVAQSGGPGAAQSLAGRWKAMFDSDIRIEKDTFIVRGRSAATLTLTVKGDSVFGTWSDAGPAPEGQVYGTYDGRTLKLTTGAREQTIRRNGEPVKMVVRTDWTGKLEDGRIRGIMLVQLGDRPALPRRWEASRE